VCVIYTSHVTETDGVDLTNTHVLIADIYYIIYIQLTEYHESCSHTTATNNSRLTSNSNRF